MISDTLFSDYAAQARDFFRRCSTGVTNNSADTEFNHLAHALFTLQFRHNLPYRQFCEGRGVSPAAVRHWAEIPAVPVSAFREIELTSLASEERQRVFHSSGTTGLRLARHFHDAGSLSLYEASLLPWFRRHFAPDTSGRWSANFISLTPPPDNAPHSSLVHMFAAIFREFGSANSIFTGVVEAHGSWTLDASATLAAMGAAVVADEPVILMGTAFNFVQLLDARSEFSNAPVHLPPGSSILETGGYKGRTRTIPKSDLHALMVDAFNLSPDRIVGEYGMCELSSQAYDLRIGAGEAGQPPARVFRFPSWARVQVVSPETGREVADGETGLIRIFDLANLRSVVAIQTEDLGIRRGTGFELLGRAAMAETRGCSLMSV